MALKNSMRTYKHEALKQMRENGELDTQVYGRVKEDMNKITYSVKETENNITQPSFIGKFLSSMRQKMYGKRKF